MKRWLLILSAVLWPSLASAQLTTMPIPLAQWFNNAGAPLDQGGLCVFRAGTSTLASTFTTAAGSVANANPVLFDSAGRPSSGGVFLTSGESYKFVLKDFTGIPVPSRTCVPDTGITIWTVDDVDAVAAAVPNVDVPGTAGQSLVIGQVVYLSDGTGGLNAGQWYLADADLPYASTLPLVGIATQSASGGSAATIRITGFTSGLTGLTSGADHYISSTPGGITATAPAGWVRLLGRAESSTTMVLAPNPRPVPTSPTVPCGRLTLTTGLPVTVADVTAATTLYYSPYGGCNTVSTYTGTLWAQRQFSEISIAVPSTTSTMYDVFAFDNGGVLTLELTAWTNDTTRATALVLQNAVEVRSGALTRLYLGSFRTTTVSGQTEDSREKRFVYNRYRQVDRELRRVDTTDSWGWDTASYHQANASTSNQVGVVIGIAENPVDLTLIHYSSNVNTVNSWAAIGYDSTTTPIGAPAQGTQNLGSIPIQLQTRVVHYPAIGFHFYAWLERGSTGTTTWYGDNGNSALMQTGLDGRFKQ